MVMNCIVLSTFVSGRSVRNCNFYGIVLATKISTHGTT